MNFKTLTIAFLFTLPGSRLLAQNSDAVIKAVDEKLASRIVTISIVLSDPYLMPLHSLTAFREVIKKNAKAEKISLVTNREPGEKITVKGVVLDKTRTPQKDLLIYVYQTSSEGWYSDTAPHILQNEGDRRHARLFGYFKADADGKFEFETVKPKGYPNSSLPAHIHIEIQGKNGSSYISELLFDDDPRLVGQIRARAIEEHFIIEKNIGTKDRPLFSYVVQFPN